MQRRQLNLEVETLSGPIPLATAWSLALAAEPNQPLLLKPSAEGDSGPVTLFTPSELGVTATSTPAFLKALDLGGGDQRLLQATL